MSSSLPPRFVDIKRSIAAENPNFEQDLTKAWTEVLVEMGKVTAVIAKEGSAYIPQVAFADLDTLTPQQIADIKRKGTVVVKDVVDDAQARKWKTELEEFIKANPQSDGMPEGDKQFFHLYWTKPQIQARAHPNMLKVSTWLNNLYHVTSSSGQSPEGVDLATPLSYADRFRIRHPGVKWTVHTPHVDGGSIERWEDENFRACFKDILSGNWTKHDPYALEPRLEARTSLYRRPNQSSVFRTFQGWLAISKAAPNQGTLQVFPDVLLSNAYIILRPFFRSLVPPDDAEILDAKNWVFDISTPDFPGIHARDGGFGGPKPTKESHPHMLLDKTMPSIPEVNPGDTVWWHCDVVHSVEEDHFGAEDSAVMYIPSVPLTPANKDYVARQREAFVQGIPPPDFPVAVTGVGLVGLAQEVDVLGAGRGAMGLGVVSA
ncbi:hypothetical protein FB45DRAFT_914893 [Roridomyces roridus]|uniref:DUF1479-domain-containing protein n=1 Tax=Roridomyces roridus TaxID=1738132 RepID=A0AAD7BT16_9AGAR|nr:hypothetical protein FB45DRAFT_301560 [Roridomyces roridus]KAJ7630216.1 hypothetical protein FB45DRAFT_914893 [Roridomyces roridus]